MSAALSLEDSSQICVVMGGAVCVSVFVCVKLKDIQSQLWVGSLSKIFIIMLHHRDGVVYLNIVSFLAGSNSQLSNHITIL